MVEVQWAQRKSPVLSPSSLECLRQVCTINLTAGCAHDCLYCYIRGYRNYPGESSVTLYANTEEKLRAELRRKQNQVRAVYFSPSSDLFQPVPEVMEIGYRVLKMLFEHGIRVTFLTKGVIPKKHMQLFADFAPMVFAEIGLISVNDASLRLFEPAAARAARRLKQASQLVRHGIRTEVRVDPIIPGFTDDEGSLRELFSAIASTGVQAVAASTLFLRPAITGSLRKHLTSSQFTTLMDCTSKVGRLDIHAQNSSVQALSAEIRQKIYSRVQSIAAEFGIKVKVCACKNPDLAESSCGIAGDWQSRPGIGLPMLFQ